MYFLINILFSDISFLYYYTNLNSSIIHLSYGISISSSFCERNSLGNFFETLSLNSSNFIFNFYWKLNHQLFSLSFEMVFFEAVFIASVVDVFNSIKNVLAILIAHVFRKGQKSFISNGWLFWSINHTSIAWNSELIVIKKAWISGEMSNRLPNGFERDLKQILERFPNLIDNHHWQCYNELLPLL